MRVYILNRNFEKQAANLETLDLRQTIMAGTLVMECLTSFKIMPRLRATLQTIPEVQMWVGHEAMLFDYLSAHLDELAGRFDKSAEIVAEHTKYASVLEELSANLFRTGASNYAMTSRRNIPDEVIASHRAAWVAEQPFRRMSAFPELTDLSVPYMAFVSEG